MTDENDDGKDQTKTVPFGSVASEEALKHFQSDILAKMWCPACGKGTLQHLQLRDAQLQHVLIPALPVLIPERLEMVPVSAVQLAACFYCGYYAHFLDAIIQERYDRASEAGKV